MAITEPTFSGNPSSPSAARVLRNVDDRLAGHPFTPIAELPRLQVGRPRATGNQALDAIRSEGWDEGFHEGREEGLAAGRADGFEIGLTEGRAAGYAEGAEAAVDDARRAIEAHLVATLGSLDALAAHLAGREATTFAEVESVAVDLAITLAEAILDRELAVADDPGRDALVRALALAPESGDLVAHLHPDDLAPLGDVDDLAPGRSLRLVSDTSVGRGGCVVTSGAARIDARISTALERVRQEMTR